MKRGKQIKLVGVLLYVLCAHAAFSTQADLLIGTWKVDSLQYQYEIPAELKPAFDNSIADIKKTFQLTYNADGTYETTVNNQELKGTWKLDEANATITAKPNAGEEKQFKIIQLTKNVFSFSSMIGKDEVIFVMVPDNSDTLYIILVPVIISLSMFFSLIFYKRNWSKTKKTA
jgi:hypothetical protein